MSKFVLNVTGSRLKNPVLGPDVEQFWKYFETLRKHQLKSGSRLKNPVLGPDVEQCWKYF